MLFNLFILVNIKLSTLFKLLKLFQLISLLTWILPSKQNSFKGTLSLRIFFNYIKDLDLKISTSLWYHLVICSLSVYRLCLTPIDALLELWIIGLFPAFHTVSSLGFHSCLNILNTCSVKMRKLREIKNTIMCGRNAKIKS